MNSKNFGLAMTSLLSAPLSARPSDRTQSDNANAPVFVWREVARRDAFTTEMLKNTKYKVNLYVFAGYVDKRGKERKREKKKTEKQGRLSKVQRERVELQRTWKNSLFLDTENEETNEMYKCWTGVLSQFGFWSKYFRRTKRWIFPLEVKRFAHLTL